MLHAFQSQGGAQHGRHFRQTFGQMAIGRIFWAFSSLFGLTEWSSNQSSSKSPWGLETILLHVSGLFFTLALAGDGKKQVERQFACYTFVNNTLIKGRRAYKFTASIKRTNLITPDNRRGCNFAI
jgi:hypothetical protein